MPYQVPWVFLLSRIREQYDLCGDNTEAVAMGLQRTGGIVRVIAIIVDATIVRILLVPATMRLLGRANWWSPRPLRRVYERFGISEGEPLDTAVADAAASGRRANL